MNTQLMWIIVLAIVVLAAVGFFVMQTLRRAQLRQRFGPEYDRTVRESGDVRKAEAALQARTTRVERLHIRSLTPNHQEQFSQQWRAVQARFVDDPDGAVTEADRLIGEVMTARGYPVGDFEQRVEDISVDHADVVMHYRAARDIAQAHAQGRAATEDLRQAMIHYRALFASLLADDSRPPEPKAEPQVAGRRRS